MSTGLSPESNVGDLIDYLLERGIDIHIFMPNGHDPSLQIRLDCADAYGRPIKNVKCIDMIKYKSATPETRNMIVAQTIHELIKELTIFR